VAVSLADKLDTLISFYTIGEVPTGSKDPFALRRAALGSISLILNNDLRISLLPILFELFKERVALFNQDFMAGAPQGIISLLADRLKVQQREAGVRHDLIDAVFALGGEDDLVRLLARVKALQAFVGTDEGTNLLAGYKRAANILKQNPSPLAGEGGAIASGEGRAASAAQKNLLAADAAAPSPSAPDGAPPSPAGGEGLLDAERALLTALGQAEPLATSAIEREDFEAAMTALASLRAPIDAFFEGVMVNDPDPDKRAYRLGLLTRFRDAVHCVADFSKIEG
jgi:glycyl-tRNA synthetase beta chain